MPGYLQWYKHCGKPDKNVKVKKNVEISIKLSLMSSSANLVLIIAPSRRPLLLVSFFFMLTHTTENFVPTIKYIDKFYAQVSFLLRTVQKDYIQKHYNVDDGFNLIDFQGTPNQA